MVQIVWTRSAKKDLKQVSDYISKDSVKYAQNQIQCIYNKTEILVKLPQ
jgi:toxin ParE1/3/4